MKDTSIQAEEVRLRVLGGMSPTRRLALAAGWSSSLRDLIRGSLKRQFPDATEQQLHRMLAERWLGPELAAKAYGAMISHG